MDVGICVYIYINNKYACVHVGIYVYMYINIVI